LEGIDLIRDRILEQAREKADEINDRTKAQRDEIMAAAEQECLQIKADSVVKTKARVDAILNRARSLAAMESRKFELQKRQNQIDLIIERALKKACSLPAEQKLELYCAMIEKSGAENGEITLSEADAGLADALQTRLGTGFTVAGTNGKFNGGLILGRGKIEDNLTFDLIVRNQRPQLSAVAAEALAQAALESGKEQI
jgi:V/A-type H+-transporting ATPase subunit E